MSLESAENQYNHYVSMIDNILSTYSYKRVYNTIVKDNRGVETYNDGCYRVVVEAKYDYEWLEVSLWYEPNFVQRKQLKVWTSKQHKPHHNVVEDKYFVNNA